MYILRRLRHAVANVCTAQEKHDNVTFEVVTSMIEIYSEKIRDLLGKGRAGHLKVSLILAIAHDPPTHTAPEVLYRVRQLLFELRGIHPSIFVPRKVCACAQFTPARNSPQHLCPRKIRDNSMSGFGRVLATARCFLNICVLAGARGPKDGAVR